MASAGYHYCSANAAAVGISVAAAAAATTATGIRAASNSCISSPEKQKQLQRSGKNAVIYTIEEDVQQLASASEIHVHRTQWQRIDDGVCGTAAEVSALVLVALCV